MKERTTSESNFNQSRIVDWLRAVPGRCLWEQRVLPQSERNAARSLAKVTQLVLTILKAQKLLPPFARASFRQANGRFRRACCLRDGGHCLWPGSHTSPPYSPQSISGKTAPTMRTQSLSRNQATVFRARG